MLETRCLLRISLFEPLIWASPGKIITEARISPRLQYCCHRGDPEALRVINYFQGLNGTMIRPQMFG